MITNRISCGVLRVRHTHVRVHKSDQHFRMQANKNIQDWDFYSMVTHTPQVKGEQKKNTHTRATTHYDTHISCHLHSSVMQTSSSTRTWQSRPCLIPLFNSLSDSVLVLLTLLVSPSLHPPPRPFSSPSLPARLICAIGPSSAIRQSPHIVLTSS